MKLDQVALDALRTLRDVGVIRARGKSRARFAHIAGLGFANAYIVGNDVADYRLTHRGRTIAGTHRK